MKYILLFILVFSGINVFGQLETVTDQMVISDDGTIVEGKLFENFYDIQALVINANNVTIRDCFFRECTWSIVLQSGVSNITIEGNRFEMVGTAIFGIERSDHIYIRYNEGYGVGIYNIRDSEAYPGGPHGYGTSNFSFLMSSSDSEVNYNIVDNENIDTRYLEDCINFYTGSAGDSANNNTIKGNLLRGTDNTCSISGSGGGAVFDCVGSNNIIEDNLFIRMAGYGCALAGVHDSKIINNYAYYPLDHTDNYNKHPNSNVGANGGSFAFGNTNFNAYATCNTIVDNELTDNHGYSTSKSSNATASNPDNCISIGSGEVWNVYETCNGDGAFIKSGNVFPSSNPDWDSLLPVDMFANLTSEYFSSRHSFVIPSIPENLTLEVVSLTGISLDWEDNTEDIFGSYTVKRSITSGGPYIEIATDVISSEYFDNSLIPATTYFYVVTAVDSTDDKNESVNSLEVTGTTEVFHAELRSFYDFEEITGTTVIDEGTAANEGKLIGANIIRSESGGIVSNPAEGQGCVELTENVYWGRSYVEIPFADFHNSENYTLSAWVKWTYETKEWGYLFWQNGYDTSKTRHIDAWWHPEKGNIAMKLNDIDGEDVWVETDDQTDTELDIFNGEWHQVAITLEDNVNVKIWTDGQLLQNYILETPITTTDEANNLWIGCKPNNPDEHDNVSKMVGFIDRVRIYDAALTQEEIQFVYNNEVPSELPPAIPTGLVATSERGRVDLDWDDNTESDFNNFIIMRSEISSGPYIEIATDTISEYKDIGLAPSTTYYYIISSINANGYESEDSEEVSVTTLESPEVKSFYDFEELGELEVIDQGSAANDGTLIGDGIRRNTGGLISSDEDGVGCVEIFGDPKKNRDYVLIPFADFHNSPDYTYSAWVKYTYPEDEWGYMFWQNGNETEKRRHVDMWWDPRNKVVSSVVHDEEGHEIRLVPEIQQNIDMFDGEWHHVAITLENSKHLKIWEDGQLVSQTTSELPIAQTNSHDLWIGCKPESLISVAVTKMIGFIDRVRLYDEALTEGELRYLYQNEWPSEAPNNISNIKENTSFSLMQNVPNPFSSETNIEYNLTESSDVQLHIYDTLGDLVTTMNMGNQNSGTHYAKWIPGNQTVGIYFYQLTVYNSKGIFRNIKKMIIFDK